MPNKKSQRADMIIVGGGVAGLTLALLLGDLGVSVHLIEPYPPKPLKDTKPSGRTVALMQSSLNVMKAAGLWDFCLEYGTPMKIMRIIDDSIAGQDTLESAFESADIGLDYFGMNIPNAPLRAALYERVQNHKNIILHTDSLRDYTLTPALVQATLSNGEILCAPLIVGTDGRNSLVRKIAGIGSRKKEYGQSAITCIINHSCAHDNVSTEFHRTGGPFALVPLKGNQSSVVWVEKTAEAESIMRLPRDSFEQTLQDRTNGILGGITLKTPPEMWPLCSIKAKSLTAPRVALAAEAAHVISPITAQGLNLSLRDVAALAETVIDAMRVGSDHGNLETLHKYESRRALDIDTRVAGVNSLNTIVSTNNAIAKDLRRMGLKIVDHVAPLKIFAMNHGLAPALDQGRLLQGKSL